MLNSPEKEWRLPANLKPEWKSKEEMMTWNNFNVVSKVRSLMIVSDNSYLDVHIDDNSAEYIPVKKEYWISLAETSVMYRLRVLVQMSGSLLVYLEKIRTWLEKHRKLLSRYSQECSEVVAFATECFEATCCQADIFSLEPVDRSKVRKDCKKHISTGDPYKDGDRVRGVKFEFKKVKEQVKVLEGQVNYYR